MSEQATEKVGHVTTEGDEIYYEVRGHGQPLLMISGGGGDAGFYSFVADILSDEYKVITYDRRGNSRSTRNDPQNFEISQQARDAVAVLQAEGEESALVFGNSGGAVIALEMAKSQHRMVKAIVVHEPPVLRMLPDSKKWLRFFSGVYRTGFRFGYHVAMLKFARSVSIPLKTYAKVPKDLGSRMGKNHNFFVNHEMIPFSSYKPDIEKIKINGVKVFMAVGKMTLEKKMYYGRTVPILAEKFGCEMVIFPGNHLSYLDMSEEWAITLRGILHKV